MCQVIKRHRCEPAAQLALKLLARLAPAARGARQRLDLELELLSALADQVLWWRLVVAAAGAGQAAAGYTIGGLAGALRATEVDHLAMLDIVGSRHPNFDTVDS